MRIRAVVAGLVLAATALPVNAAPRPDVECWVVWEGSNLRFTAINLQYDGYGVGGFPPPQGGLYPDANGTLTALVSPALDPVILWRRGGGGSLFKPGAGLNDYHPVCSADRPPLQGG